MTNKGLTKTEIKKLLEKYGTNELVAESKHKWYHILFSQFADLLVVILIVSAVISFLMGPEHISDAFVILGIVILNAGIGFFQEFRTEKTLEALQKMVHPEIRVLRAGKESLIETKYLVPGDIVILGEGDKIPADGILLEAHSLRIEESALTGESLPVDKKADNEVFMGTSVARGSGVFEVKSTGMSTKFGEIARLTTSTKKLKSPLQIELERIGVFVAKLTGVICVVLFGLGILRGSSLSESLLFSVSVAIAAVPEGLNTTIVIALALGATVLARKKAVVKKLSSVETLGAVTTICSDKTGTLTKNEMTVREIYLADRSIFNVSGVGYNPFSGKITHIGGGKGRNTLKQKILEICAWCNEAKLINEKNKYKILGDPTEGALLTLVKKSNLDPENKKFQIPIDDKYDEIFPFDSDRKMMSIVIHDRVMVKGSPDQVLEKCTKWSDGKNLYDLDNDKREKIKAHYTRMAENALRVLAFAEKETNETKNLDQEKTESDLVFVGLVGMIDPPRDEVADAVVKCETAGIRIIVITGDYGVTAQAIARELGIVKGDDVRILTGEEVINISDEDLKELLKDKTKSIIFARSLPAQKMRIVEILQSQGEIVAMTGDGVNDAPALKKSNIGIAMGITGTEVSKEAATMILLNDSFASIVTAIEEGRRIYENLKKFVWFIFACNIGELVLIFAAILFAFPLPLTAILILCVDLGTDILPAIALGVDNPEKNLMHNPPRNTNKKLMDKLFVKDFLIVGSVIGASITVAFLYTIHQDLGWWFGDSLDISVEHGMTVAFTSLVLVQLINAFSARSFTQSIFKQNPLTNHFLLIAILTSILMVLCIIYIPFLNNILHTTPLIPKDWLVIVIASIIPLIVVEIRKYLKNTKK